MSLCKYQNILGIPKKGIHSYRIYNLAYIDIIGTFFISYILSYIFNTSYVLMLIFIFLLGILLHHIFCVQTTIGKKLFPKKSE